MQDGISITSILTGFPNFLLILSYSEIVRYVSIITTFLGNTLQGGEPTFLFFVPEHVYSANREFLHQFLNLLKNVIKKLDQNTDAMEFLHDFLTTPYSGVQPPEVDDYEVADDDFGEIGVIIVVLDILDE